MARAGDGPVRKAHLSMQTVVYVERDGSVRIIQGDKMMFVTGAEMKKLKEVTA